MATQIGIYFDASAIANEDLLETLVEATEERWGDSCPIIKQFNELASPQARKEIAADIEENELDGIVLCGTSSRVDWDIYQFSNVQIERVALRELCVKAFKAPDASMRSQASEEELQIAMAKDYVNMGVIRLQKSNIPQPESLEATRHILVVGGGWAGLSAAKAANDAGYPVTIIEKDNSLGGKAKKFYKTIPLKYPYTEAHAVDLEGKISAVSNSAQCTVLTGSQLTSLAGEPGQYTAVITTPNGEQTVAVGAVVLASGWVPQDPSVLAPLGYGTHPNIITAEAFEQMAQQKNIEVKRVAFIVNTNKCVTDAWSTPVPVTDEAASTPEGEEKGTETAFTDMETVRHLPYSNAVNSVVALKHASYVTEAHPEDGLAYILYDSMVVQGLHERYYKAAQDTPGVMLTKAEITSVTPTDSALIVSATDTLLGESIELEVDLVVLPTGIVPTTAKGPVMQFAYRQGLAFPDLSLFDGFADSNYICFPYETRRTGVYAAGCVRQPMTLDAAEDDALGATLKAIQCIESANKGVSVHPRSGDLSYPKFNFVRCTQCKRCTEECPFGALDDDEKGTPLPNPSRCRRCGTCMGACPERVISFDDYNVDQIGSMIRDIDVPDDMEAGGPRVLILACENDAYPAFDMAAMRGKPWSPYVRIIPVRCLGSVNAIWVADAMSKGIDGVMLMGCKYGDDYQCHFVKGSEICNRRKENIAETLDRLGVEPDRVAQYEVAIDEYDKVPEMVDEFMHMVFAKGPNPFKGY